MKVKVLAHKGHIVIIPSNVTEDIGDNWSPTGDSRMGSSVKSTPENLGISAEAFELMDGIKRNRDGVGDLMWSHGTFSWWGAMFRVVDPSRAEKARDFHVPNGQHTTIDNVMTDWETRAVDHALRLKMSMWKWPYGLNTEGPGTKVGEQYAHYHQGQVYIASAYSHENPKVVEGRLAKVELLCSKLVAQGVHAFSPVVYGSALMKHGPMHEDTSWNTWQHFCDAFLSNSTAVYIMKDDGWDTSIGVSGEKMKAAINGMEVFLIDPETLNIEPHHAKLPIHLMSDEDVKEICRLVGRKYSHHDTSEKGNKVFMAEDARITVYPGMSPANLVINGKGQIMDPHDFKIDILGIVKEMIDKLEGKEDKTEKDLADLEEFKGRKKDIEQDRLPADGLEKAKEIINKYQTN